MKFTVIILLTYFILMNLLPVAKFIKMEIMDSCENKCMQHCNKQKSKEGNNPFNKQNCILNINLSSIFDFLPNNFTFSDVYFKSIAEKQKYYFKEIILNGYISKIWQPPKIIC
ncbi:MAG: hypothetical protein HOI81_01685 [Nitrosomonadales bacterium]|nr:hypothetical protein [Lentimicrobiaceae bacterium]MBT5669549.1 hypothetical protein [Lentimicrobiaceae bacterium]MBT6250732.1 hypothetical protein [Nitrosomonadales bacterium]MBT6962742.1 hypothetical protein [Lentimicrobiaceae bacterium]